MFATGMTKESLSGKFQESLSPDAHHKNNEFVEVKHDEKEALVFGLVNPHYRFSTYFTLRVRQGEHINRNMWNGIVHPSCCHTNKLAETEEESRRLT